MSTLLHRLGGLAYRRPWAFIITWVLLLGGVLGFAATSGGQISSSLTIDGTPSQQVMGQLEQELPAASGGQGTIVFTVPQGERLDSGARATAIAAAAGGISGLPVIAHRPPPEPGNTPGASNSSSQSGASQGTVPEPGAPAPSGSKDQSVPYRPLIADGSPVPGVMVSIDGSVAMLQMQFTTQVDDLPKGTTDNIVAIAEHSTADSGVTALASKSLQAMHPPIGGDEAIGLIVALLVLLLTLGSLWSAGLPILTALTGVAIGIGGAFALSATITLTTATPALAMMVGLAVGVDYALFIVYRQRRLILFDGLSAPAATAKAVATAGSAVVFAGSTVVIALTGLTVIGIGFLTTMALVAATTVALAVMIALTLLPALLGLIGEKVCSTKARATAVSAATNSVTSHEEKHLANRWVNLLVRRPWIAIGSVVIVLGLAAIPASAMYLGMPTGATDSVDNSARQSYDAITRGFGEGFNAPLIVVAHPTDGSTLDPQNIGAITHGLQSTDHVTAVTPMGASPDGALAMFRVIPDAGPDAENTADLVRTLRSPDSGVATSAKVTLGVTGLSAINIDISERLGSVLPEYIAIIVGLSLILLLLVFRSIIIPIKATLGFLLSIAATFGITTAVFQWGWFQGLVGIDTSGPLLSFLPIMVTGILYGLAMDYQVFLVSSMREAKTHGMPARRAIVHGFNQANRVVLAAAIIMTSVFASFVLTDDPMIKQFGFALAVGVLIDAFLVRMTLVPAIMSLLGEYAWWLPKWLDRFLPNISLEGENEGEDPGEDESQGQGRVLPSAEPPDRTPEPILQ